MPRGEILNRARHAFLHLADRLAPGHGPLFGVGVEIAHLLGELVLHVAPGAPLPHAHADLRQARRGHGGNVVIARDRLGCHARARQAAAVERINVLVPESLRERVDLLQTERGDAAVPVALNAAVEVALCLRVPDQINFRHCAPPKLDHSGIIQYNNLNPHMSFVRECVNACTHALYRVFAVRTSALEGKVKVIHLISGGDTGGARTHVYSLLKYLGQIIDVQLVCFRGGDFADGAAALGIPTMVLDRGFAANLGALKKLIRAGEYDLVHCHGSMANVMGALLRRSVRVPVISTVHSDYRLDYLGRPFARAVYGTLNIWALHQLDYRVCVSDPIRQRLIDRGFEPNRLFSIYNGLDFSHVVPKTDRAAYFAQFGYTVHEGDVIAGIAARLDPVKDIPTLIRAVALAQKACPQLRLAIAGEGMERKKLEALAAELGIADSVFFLGWVNHESRRVDRQLRGRAGRQGDPGSSVFFVSLEDDLMRLFSSDRIASVMDKLGFKEGEMIEHKMISNSIERAQKKVEENNFGIRKRLLEYDDVMNKQRVAVYTKRRHALMGERIGMDIVNMIWDRCAYAVELGDFDNVKMEILQTLAMEVPFTEEEYNKMRKEDLAEKTFEAAMNNFKRKTDRMAQIANPVIKQVYEMQGHMYENIMIPITDGKRLYNISVNLKAAYETEGKEIVKSFEKAILLHTIDDAWKENLRELDELKHSVQNASYEQKDPLLIFKLESVNLFDNMVNKINNNTISVLMRGQIPVQEPEQVREAAPEPQAPRQQYREEKQDLSDPHQQAAAEHDTREVKREPVRAEKTVGRNDPCPCGSGKKYKNCHGQNA